MTGKEIFDLVNDIIKCVFMCTGGVCLLMALAFTLFKDELKQTKYLCCSILCFMMAKW